MGDRHWNPWMGCVLIGVAVSGVASAAQTPSMTPTVSVHGLAFDSLHSTPLANATITMVGSTEVAESDVRGRFTFANVSPGRHTFVAYHAALDSIGLAGISRTVTVDSQHSDVTLALPSFETMWGRVCPGPVHSDTGFVYGTVLDAVTRRAMAGAAIALSWFDVSLDSAKYVRQKRWRANAVSDSSGAYAICGVPAAVVPSIQATKGDESSGIIDLVGDKVRLRRRDLMMGRVAANDGRGTIIGTVTNPGGSPFSGARVVLLEVPEVKTDRAGRFVVQNVPAGTRELEILALGSVPSTLTVDVTPHDTVYVTAEVRKLTTLDVVKVIGSASQRRALRDIDDRRRMGFGQFLDSSAIKGIGSLASTMTGFPSVVVQRIGNANKFVVTLPQGAGRCVANLFVDGVRQGGIAPDADTFSILDDMHPEDIALIEVYAHGASVPTEFESPWSECGVIAVWTKWMIRG